MDQLLAWVRQDFGLALTRPVPVHGGADAHADLWRATAPDGTRYAVKWSGGGSPAGLALTAVLAAAGVPGIPGPRPARDGRPWSSRGGRRLSVVPWIEDPVAWRGTMTPAHWAAYGRLLSALHATALPPELAALLPPRVPGHARFAAVARDVTARVAGSAVEPHWPVAAVEALIARADRLAARAAGGPEVACHGDPHLLNVLSGGDHRVWLIDWDDAMRAPREWDLMFVFGGVLGRVTPEQLGWFLDGYGPISPDPDRLAYFHCVRALDDAGDWARTALDAGSPEERSGALDIVRHNFGPEGQVTYALS